MTQAVKLALYAGGVILVFVLLRVAVQRTQPRVDNDRDIPGPEQAANQSTTTADPVGRIKVEIPAFAARGRRTLDFS